MLSSNAAPPDEGVQSDKEADLNSRLLVLESKLEEIKQLLSQSNSVESDAPPNVIDRRAEFFSTYYVTLISIIQAAALGYLLLAAKDQLSYITAGIYDPIWTVLILGMFIQIVASWAMYSNLASALKLRPTTLEALIPFCFGAAQALAIFCISIHQLAWFYFAMAAIALVAFLNYFFSYRNVSSHQEYEEHRVMVELGGSFSRSMMPRVYTLRGLIFLSFGVVEALFNLQSLLLGIVYLILNALLIFMVHASTEKFHQMISELRPYKG